MGAWGGEGLGQIEPNKDSLSQTHHQMCLTPQNGQRQLRLGIPLASQFPNEVDAGQWGGVQKGTVGRRLFALRSRLASQDPNQRDAEHHPKGFLGLGFRTSRSRTPTKRGGS